MLFGDKKNKKKKTESSSGEMETIIGENTEIEGQIKTEGSLRIDGKLNGKLKAQEDVIVGENGVLEANIEARNVTVAGSVKGNIVTEGKLVIVSTGKLIGDIKIANLIVEDGAVFKGKSESRSATTKRFTTENDSEKNNKKNSKKKKDKQEN